MKSRLCLQVDKSSSLLFNDVLFFAYRISLFSEMHRSHWHPAEENGYAFDLIFRQFIIGVLPWSLISHTYFERAVACGLSLFFRADLSWPYLVLNLFFCHTYVCFDFHVWDLHTSFINN